ncbi:MAG: hypothetical protein K0S74_1861 [Chlamydiales bacterium]|jgi:hypothetical protein|nr:hypothetical protein [Chlamydiales bacterium]
MAKVGKARIDVVYVKTRIKLGFKRKNHKLGFEVRREYLSENKKVVLNEVLYNIGWGN